MILNIRYIFVVVLSLVNATVFSQTVENIKVEPEGEDIRITYRIGDSVEGQLYHVKLECSIDGGARFVPVSVLGDVGDNIRGGKSYYSILWEVFKDLEEVGEAEFFITIKMMEEDSHGMVLSEIKTTSALDDSNDQIFIGFSGSPKTQLGIMGGYMENWGFYAAFRMGFTGHSDMRFSVTGGVTKRVMQKGNFSMNGYLGGGRGDYLDEYVVEAGLVNVINNRFNVNIGFAVPSYYFDLTFGFGIVF